MKRLLVCALIAWSLFDATAARAQAQALDVPYVGTPANVVDAMLKLANVGPGDYVVDLGCGDGRMVIAAAKRYGARGFGVDLDPQRIEEANENARKAGVADRVAFYERNLYITDFSKASVLALYLFPRVNLDLRPRLFKEVRPGTRVVSHDFDFGRWKPDAQETVAVPDKPYGEPRSTIYFWIVPADASGRWTWNLPEGDGTRAYEVTLEQTFQMLRAVPSGSVEAGGGSMRGEEIRLALKVKSDGRETREDYHGQLHGDTIQGSVTIEGAGQFAWRAKRLVHGRIDIEGRADSGTSNLK